jgi:hypothetical protein
MNKLLLEFMPLKISKLMAYISGLPFTNWVKIKKGAYTMTVAPATMARDITVTVPVPATGAAANMVVSVTGASITDVEVITHTDTKKYLKLTQGATLYYVEMRTTLP